MEMDQEEAVRRLDTFRVLLDKLVHSVGRTVADVVGNEPRGFDVEGVYCISLPDDRKIVYIGQTRSKKVIGRVRDHRSNNGTSDLRCMLKNGTGDYPQAVDEYVVRCIEVADPKQRAFFEHFAMAVVQPPFNA